MDLNHFNNEEFLELALNLEQHHSIFSKFWNMSKPVFSEKLSTAGVYFDKVGECIDFEINPSFWASLTQTQKLFVISHECLHVILHHGLRMLGMTNQNPKAWTLANITADIIVNHSLLNNFGFKRDEIDPTKKYCWVDTVFPDKEIPSDKFFEYYYNLLVQKQEAQSSSNKGDLNSQSNPEIVDDHDGLSSFDNSAFEEELKKNLLPDDLQSIQEFVEKNTNDLENAIKQAGCDPGLFSKIIKIGFVKPKKKWETVIKQWSKKFLREKEHDQWIKKNRRYHNLDTNFFLPTTQEIEFHKKEKIQVWFFQDTSGSCAHLAKRFFTCAKSLPSDRFEIKLFCFDTRVHPTTLESGKLYGFGGTTFTCIDRYIEQEIQKTGCKYPTIFCITDGYGDKVNPRFPKKWFWFLSTNSRNCIPFECNIFSLSDFE